MDFKSLRQQSGLSLNQLATRTGYSKSYVVKVEGSEFAPSARYREAFQRAINQAEKPLDQQIPITKLVQELGAKNAKNKSILADVKPALLKLKDFTDIATSIVELADSIASQQAVSSVSPNESDIDLADADPETIHAAQEDIINTIIQALKKWNVHKLPIETQKNSVRHLATEVIERL